MQEIKALKTKIQNHIGILEIDKIVQEFKGLKEENLKKIIKSSGILEQLSLKIINDKCTSHKAVLRITMVF